MLALQRRHRAVVELDLPRKQGRKGPALGQPDWRQSGWLRVQMYSSVDASLAAARISIFHLRHLVISPSNLEKVGIVDARTVELGNRVARYY
jgi:hypothetical protein